MTYAFLTIVKSATSFDLFSYSDVGLHNSFRVFSLLHAVLYLSTIFNQTMATAFLLTPILGKQIEVIQNAADHCVV